MTEQTKARRAAADHRWYIKTKDTEKYKAKNRAAQAKARAKAKAENPEAYRIYHNAAAKKWAKQNRAKCRRRELKRDYGITPEDVTNLLTKQAGCCVLCGRLFGFSLKHNVDHCHRTKRVRGLLCGSCNMRLGVFEGLDATWAQRARTYLEGK